MKRMRFLAAAAFAVGLPAVACDRDRSPGDDDITVEEQLEAADRDNTVDDDKIVPAVPHGTGRTILTKDPDGDDDESAEDALLPSPGEMPPPSPVSAPAPSGDPRLTVPEDDTTPAQQENSNRQYENDPLPP